MKNILYICLVCMIPLSCISEEKLQEFTYSIDPTKFQYVESSLTIEQALKNIDYIYKNIDKDLGRTRKIHNIDLITSNELKNSIITRSSSNIPNNQPIAYIVNYEDEAGYAILSADAKLPPVIMIGDNGNFSTERFINFLDTNTTRSTSTFDFADSLQYMMISNSLVLPEFDNEFEGEPLITARDTNIILRCAPLVPTKWSQKSPYNYFSPTDTDNTQKYPAGCVPVACAQVLASLCYHHNFRPCTDISTNYPVDWSLLNSVISADTIKYNSTDRTPGALNIASLIRSIGEITVDTYSHSGTGGETDLFVDTLLDIGCSSAQYMFASALPDNTLFDMIVAKNFPVIADAWHQTTSGTMRGHCFIIDGWLRLEYTMNMIYKIPGTNMFNDHFEIGHKQFDLVHVNFGWGGKSDGYYIPRSFDISNHEFDDYQEDNDEPIFYPYNFCISTCYLTYDL